MATKKKKLKKIDPHTDYGIMETPTIQYHYGETGPFIPKTYTCSIKSVTEQIIREYLRAKKEEKRIETKVEVETERAISAETKLESGITANTASILANAQAILDNLKLISANTEAIETETKERKEEIAKVEEKVEEIETKVEELSEEDKKLYDYLKSLDEEVDSIRIEQDTEDNRKYYLKLGDEIKSEFTVPNDGFLRNVTFDEESNNLIFTVGDGVEEKTITTDLSALVDKYNAGYGLKLNDNVFSLNINENSSFIYFNDEQQVDFGMKVIKDPYNEGDIWDYYIVGKNDEFPTYNSAKLDLHEIGDYLDKKGEDIRQEVNEHIDERADEILATVDSKVESGVTEAKDYTDNEIDNLRKEIEDKLNTMFIAGNNIKLDKDADGNVTISVKIDNDIHVKDESLLTEALPIGGDTLDDAIIKVLNNVVTNADTSDGEIIEF